MKRLEFPEECMKDLEAYAISAFRANAKNVLNRNIMRAICLGCHEWASLVLEGFGGEGRIRVICLKCGANLEIGRDNRMRLSDSGYAGGGYCDLIKQYLSTIGIDWQTGQAPKHPSPLSSA